MGLCGEGHHTLDPNARGGLQIHGGVQRPSLYQPQGTEVQTLLPTESRYKSCRGRHNAVKLQGTMLLLTYRRDRARSTPVCAGFPWPVGPSSHPSPQLTLGNWSVCTSLVLYKKNSNLWSLKY